MGCKLDGTTAIFNEDNDFGNMVCTLSTEVRCWWTDLDTAEAAN